MVGSLSLADYLSTVGLQEDDDLMCFGGTNNGGASASLSLIPTSTVVEVVVSHTTLQKEEYDPKSKGPTETSQKLPPPSSTSGTKKMKVTKSTVTTTELSLEDFEAYVKVGKLCQDLFIRWNANVSSREQGNQFEAKNLLLGLELQDKTEKLTFGLESLSATREEAEKFRLETDTLQARLDSLATTDANVEKLKKELAEANKRAELAGEVPDRKRQLEELGNRNNG